MNNPCKSILPVSALKTWFQKGFVVPLIEKIPCTTDPWELFLRLPASSYEFFLDSGKSGKHEKTFSYFGKKPFLVLKKKDKSVWIEKSGRKENLKGNFLETLRKLFLKWKGKSWNEFPFFTGGAIGVFGYGLAWEFEKLPRTRKKETPFEDCVLLFAKNLFVYDHTKNELYLISNLIPSETSSFESALLESLNWIRSAHTMIKEGRALTNGHVSIQEFKADVGKPMFKKIVKRAKEYIRSGDIYQANLAQQFSFRFSGSPETLYAHLLEINPSPFASFLKFGDSVLVSSSPERLIRKRGMRCETRPIAGTRPRGKSTSEKIRFKKELLANPKERAEHLMLVDLERNDLGRVSKPHSVRVSEMLSIEEYSHVIHLVSNIEGELERGKDQFDLLRAMFPGGTITGCPKIRSMEIIEELEPFRRSFYTGSLGYLGFNGDMDLNIIIRTILLKGEQGYFHVGAGIVYDSDPESEYWETMHKGKALIDTLDFAQSK